MLNTYLNPLKTVEEAFLLLYLHAQVNSEYEISFIQEVMNKTFDSLYNIETLKNTISKYCYFLHEFKAKMNLVNDLIKNRESCKNMCSLLIYS